MAIKNILNQEVVTISPRASVMEAARLMKITHVGDLVVVEEKEGRRCPVGILTDRDIVRFVVADGAPAEKILVQDIMARSLKTVKEGDGILETIRQMQQGAVRRLPVVDESGYLTGIVSIDDLVVLLSQELARIGTIYGTQIRRERDLSRVSTRFV